MSNMKLSKKRLYKFFQFTFLGSSQSVNGTIDTLDLVRKVIKIKGYDSNVSVEYPLESLTYPSINFYNANIATKNKNYRIIK